MRNSFNTILLMAFACVMMASTLASAEESLPKSGPMHVTSDRLTTNNRENTALFEGSVVANNNIMNLKSDSMKVHYTPEGGVNRIVAKGNVVLIRDAGIVTSQMAVFDASSQKLTFTGEPRAIEGANIITGTKMIYFLQEERSMVENSKVFLKSKPLVESNSQ